MSDDYDISIALSEFFETQEDLENEDWGRIVSCKKDDRKILKSLRAHSDLLTENNLLWLDRFEESIKNQPLSDRQREVLLKIVEDAEVALAIRRNRTSQSTSS